jgi:GDP-L-fucose synthase
MNEISLLDILAKVISYQGGIKLDLSKPDGAPRKWMDSSRLSRLRWIPSIDLEMGLIHAYGDLLY